MENDDKPTGQILSRRDALKLLGIGSAALLASRTSLGKASSFASMTGSTVSSALSCVVRPELTIGPYFVDDQLNRSDIRSDPFEGFVKEGVSLGLNIGVFSVGNKSCSPLAGARVDVWHCDAFGVYSDVLQPGFDTRPQKFLRGYQITDAKGSVHFQTIYPGWYSGRTVHIHFMIRMKGTSGQSYEFTSQLFFLDALTDTVHAREPYVRKDPRDTRNLQDSVFKNGGNQLLLNVIGDRGRGYIAGINIGLDLANAKVGKPDTFQ